MIIEVRMYPEKSTGVITYPIAYKRKLTGIYYNVMEQAYGKKFTEMFHKNTGVPKMVAISDLFPRGKLVGDNVAARAKYLKFYISSPNDTLVTPFLSVDEIVFLGKKWHVEADTVDVDVNRIKYFKTLSPVKVTSNDKRTGLSAGSLLFWETLYRNFERKYKLLHGDSVNVEFDILSMKKRVVKVYKNEKILNFDTYDLEFKINNADVKILRTLEAGLGESNLTGFGFVLPIA